MASVFTEKSYIFIVQNSAFFAPIESLPAANTSRPMPPFNALKLPTGCAELYIAVCP
jgi:hypothetical protein